MAKKSETSSKKLPPHTKDVEVNRALTQVYKDINELVESVNLFKGKEADDNSEGKEGDVKVVKSPQSKEYSLQIYGEDGWLEDKTAKYVSINALVDIKQEQKKKSIPSHLGGLMPPPDYDSGFFNIELSKQYVTGATDGVVPDDSPFYYAPHIVGIPALGFSCSRAPSLIQLQMAPYNVKSFDDAMTSKVLVLDWQNQYYGSGSMGVKCHMSSPKHISFNTSDQYLYHSKNTGGYDIASNSTDFFDAFDTGGSSNNISMRVTIWK